MPSNKILKQAFQNNGDGFGLAYKLSDRVPHIKKGAMTFKAMKRLIKSLPNLTNAEVIMHFRLATQGHIYEGNCHPFPISPKIEHLTALEIDTKMAIVHNGIIYSSSYSLYGANGTGTDAPLTDTQEFIRDYLVDIGDAIFNKGVRKLIEDDTMSKFAILTTKGILLIGTFSQDKGLYFSNDSYKKVDYYVPTKKESTLQTQKWGGDLTCDLCDQPTFKTYFHEKKWLCYGCLAALTGDY